MNLSDDIKKAASLIGEIDTILPIKVNIYNTSCVYQINFVNHKCILKVFNVSDNMGKSLFQRECMAYGILNKELEIIPKILYKGDNFFIIEYCDDHEIIDNENLTNCIAKVHNALNCVKNNENLKFDFFGNGESIVTSFINEFRLVEKGLITESKTEILITIIDELLNTENCFLCHGDISRSNLRVANNNTKIIDFECLSNLPLEFDLAILCSYEILLSENIIFENCIQNYLNKLNFNYKFNNKIFRKVLIFDSIRKCRFAKKSNLVKKEMFYFERFLKLLEDEINCLIKDNYEDSFS